MIRWHNKDRKKPMFPDSAAPALPMKIFDPMLLAGLVKQNQLSTCLFGP